MKWHRLLEPLSNRIKMVLNRALIDIVNDSTDMQLVQISIMSDEVKTDVERIQDYGFTSKPLKGSEALVGFINGNKDQGIVIKVDNAQYRLKGLEDGEVAMYNNTGAYVKMKKDGEIVMSSEKGITLSAKTGEDVVVNGKNVTVNLESGGTFSVAGSNLTVDA